MFGTSIFAGFITYDVGELGFNENGNPDVDSLPFLKKGLENLLDLWLKDVEEHLERLAIADDEQFSDVYFIE